MIVRNQPLILYLSIPVMPAIYLLKLSLCHLFLLPLHSQSIHPVSLSLLEETISVPFVYYIYQDSRYHLMMRFLHRPHPLHPIHEASPVRQSSPFSTLSTIHGMSTHKRRSPSFRPPLPPPEPLSLPFPYHPILLYPTGCNQVLL